jgi:hypothetical protein
MIVATRGFGRSATLALAALASGAAPAAPVPAASDFGSAANLAAAFAVEGGSPATAELTILGGTPLQAMTPADYRRLRTGCELVRLIRVQGDGAIGVEWRCGPLLARSNDVYNVADRRVVRILTDVPFFVTPPRPLPEPR